MQMAIWRILGLSSSDPANSVTSDVISQDTINAVAAQAKRDPAYLQTLVAGGAKLSPTGELIPSKEQKKRMTDSADVIFAAIDLTVRHTQEPALANVVVPKTSWDGYYDVGFRTYQNGDFTEAGELLDASVTEAEAFGEADDRLSKSLVAAGECYSDFGNLDGAEAYLDRALNLRNKVHGSKSVEVAEVDNDLGMVKQRKDLYDPAETLFVNAFDISSKAANSSGKFVAKVLTNLGRNYCLKNNGHGEPENAIPKLQQAMVLLMQNNQNTKTPELAEVETNLGRAYMQGANMDKSAKFLDEALAIATSTLGDNHPFVAVILAAQAELAKRQDNLSAAESYMKKAEEINKLAFNTGAKALERFPASYDAMKRFQLYCIGMVSINLNKEKLLKEAESLSAPSSEKINIDKPVADKWAVVIGISKYQDPSINLKYSAKDAHDFAEFLTKQEHFAPDHVHLLVNEQATKEKIMSEIGDKFLPRVVHPDDLVVIYLSGHGSPSKVDIKGANFFVAYNTDKNALYGTGLEMRQFAEMVKNRVPCERTVLMLDACHSGAIEGAKGLFKVNNFDAKAITQGTGKLTLCSSRPDEVSWESKRYPNSVFTHSVIESFHADGSERKLGDALKRVGEMVAEEVQRDRGEDQHPAFFTKWVGADLVLGAPAAQPREGMPQQEASTTSSSLVSDSQAEFKAAKNVPAKPAAKTPVKSATTVGTKGTKPPAKPVH